MQTASPPADSAPCNSHLYCAAIARREEEVVARSPSALQGRSARGSSTSLSGSQAAAGSSSADGGPSAGDGSSTPKAAGAAAAAADTAGGDALSRKRAFKEKWQEGVALFNKKPKKGIAMLQVRAGQLGWAWGVQATELGSGVAVGLGCFCLLAVQEVSMEGNWCVHPHAQSMQQAQQLPRAQGQAAHSLHAQPT